MSRPARRRPLYARVLRLRHLQPSSLLCFLFLEGMIALGVLLALAELVSWWAVPGLPVAVAAMVKLNDVIASAGDRQQTLPTPDTPRPPAVPAEPAVGTAAAAPVSPAGRTMRQVSRDLVDTLDPVDSPRQRFRQSARRRYE